MDIEVRLVNVCLCNAMQWLHFQFLKYTAIYCVNVKLRMWLFHELHSDHSLIIQV